MDERWRVVAVAAVGEGEHRVQALGKFVGVRWRVPDLPGDRVHHGHGFVGCAEPTRGVCFVERVVAEDGVDLQQVVEVQVAVCDRQQSLHGVVVVEHHALAAGGG